MRNIVMLSILTACNSKQTIENAECSDAEQGMFLACIEAGCSAEYTQSLEGNDVCSVEGSGSYVSVGAGGECGFSSSGSCYVVCDCPEGLSVTYEVQDDTGVISDPGTVPDSMKPEDITGYELRAILGKIDDVKTSCNQSVNLLNQKLEEKDSQISELQEKIAALESQDSAIYSYVDSNISLVQWGLQSEVDTLVQSDTDIKTSIADISNQITSINDTLADQQDQLDELYSSSKSSSLIVSQYDVMCYSGSTYKGTGTPLHPYTFYSYTGVSEQLGCIIANIDPEDPPYVFELTQIFDNTLTYPQYSRTDSIARYGADRPELYSGYVNWGNDIFFRLGTVPAVLGSSWITSTGDVVYYSYSYQTDSTVPGIENVTDIPVRVTIIHDRAYTAP